MAFVRHRIGFRHRISVAKPEVAPAPGSAENQFRQITRICARCGAQIAHEIEPHLDRERWIDTVVVDRADQFQQVEIGQIAAVGPQQIAAEIPDK